jgi:hypothetical protein
MKVENLKTAQDLREKLRIINHRIETANGAKFIKLEGENSFDVSTKNMKYDSIVLLESIKLLFLNSLTREKQDILNDIEELD